MSQLYFPTSVIHGAGSLQKLGEVAQELNCRHLYVICSKRTKAEISRKMKDLKNEYDIELDFFTDFSGEPTTDHVHHAIKQLKQCRADSIVAIGGGTPIDLAKAVSVLAKEKQLTIKHLHTQKQLQRYPLIAIPTTSGTGSEVTKISVITDPSTSVKYNPAHPRLLPDFSILDPELTIHLPKQVTAQTGMDALAHAMEAYVSTKASPITDTFALEAMKLIRSNIKNAYYDPGHLEARDGMLRGSFLAGLAFSNASTNLAHATARPLGSRFNLPHGLSVALTLPPVIEYGSEVSKERYDEVAHALQTESTYGFVNQLNKELSIYEDAREMLDGNELLKAIPTLVKDALSGNGIQTNAKIPTEKDVENIYINISKAIMEV